MLDVAEVIHYTRAQLCVFEQQVLPLRHTKTLHLPKLTVTETSCSRLKIVSELKNCYHKNRYVGFEQWKQ